MNSRIFLGTLHHARRLDHALSFSYPMYMLWLDLDELSALDHSSRLFGYNRTRLLSIRDRDYISPDPEPIRTKLAKLLKQRGIDLPDGRVMLLTCARYLNYVFNPVSFYFAYRRDESLAVAVCEVNNTFKERHVYVLDDRQRLPAESGYRYARDKDFHVSPFMDLAGRYDFAFRFPDNGVDIQINLEKAEQKTFHAHLAGHFLPAHSTNIRNTILKYPLTGLATMTRILMQATKLYARGATVYERPTPVSQYTVVRRAQSVRIPLAARGVLRLLEHIEHGQLHVTLPDGTQRQFGNPAADAPITLTFHDWRVFGRLVRDGDIALGETYMSGDWSTNDLTGLIRLLLANRDAIAPVASGNAVFRLGYRLIAALRRNTLTGSRRNIAAHYDLSNELFSLFLDPSMTYSSAYFEYPGQSLEEAQTAKYRKLCEKVALKDGDHVLEIGCGWGGFACFAARYANCRVTAVTISQEQFNYAQERIQREGLADRITVVLEDYRNLQGQTFDKIVSIEMFEAVGYEFYPGYFQTIDRLLKRDGLFAMQTITYPEQGFDQYRKSFDWIKKYIFPGGLLPSIEVMACTVARHTSFVIHDLENIGIHYAETLKRWRTTFNERIDEVRALGFDRRFENMWNFYLSYCEAAFAARYLGDVQLVLARPVPRDD